MQTKTNVSKRAGINNIARKQGTGKVDPVYYNPKAPHNQVFFKYREASSKA